MSYHRISHERLAAFRRVMARTGGNTAAAGRAIGVTRQRARLIWLKYGPAVDPRRAAQITASKRAFWRASA